VVSIKLLTLPHIDFPSHNNQVNLHFGLKRKNVKRNDLLYIFYSISQHLDIYEMRQFFYLFAFPFID